VLDTNVLVAAAYDTRSASRCVVEACLGGGLTPVLSRARRRAAAAASPGSGGQRRGSGCVHAPRPGGTGRRRGCPRHRPRWPASAPDNVSGRPHDLAFARREADNPGAISENSDERGGGPRDKLFPNHRPAFRAGAPGRGWRGRGRRRHRRPGHGRPRLRAARFIASAGARRTAAEVAGAAPGPRPGSARAGSGGPSCGRAQHLEAGADLGVVAAVGGGPPPGARGRLRLPPTQAGGSRRPEGAAGR
jgi:hypothetical protein